MNSKEASEPEDKSVRKRRVARPASSPTATGGEGTTFEHRVGGIFLAEMLAEIPSDYFDCDRITGVGFQGGTSGIVPDDIEIEYVLNSRVEHFDLDCKSAIRPVPSNKDFQDVVDGCLTRYDKITERPGIYGFATAVGNHVVDINALQQLIKRAANEERPEVFEARIQEDGYVTNDARRVYGHLKTVCLEICPTLTSADIHAFLYRFKVVILGVGPGVASARNGAAFRIQQRFGKSLEDAESILDHLGNLASDHQGGFLRRKRLTEKLNKRHVQLDTAMRVGIRENEIEGMVVSASPNNALALILIDGFTEIRDVAHTALSERVVSARAALREGRYDDCGRLIDELKSKAQWRLLSTDEQMRVLTLEARLAISRGASKDVISEILSAAETLDAHSADLKRLRLSLQAMEEGSGSVLPLLVDCVGLEMKQFRAALLLEDDKIQDGLDLLAECEENGETWRLRTIGSLLLERRDEALEAAAHGLQSDPKYQGMQMAAALADFDAAVSPGFPSSLSRGPNPIPEEYVRADKYGMAHLAAAERRFAEMLLVNHEPTMLPGLETFHLGTLFLQPERRAEAKTVALNLLDKDPSHRGAIPWALAYGVEFDLSRTIESLLTKVKSGPQPHDIANLATVYVSAKRPSEALRVVNDYKMIFIAGGDAEQYYQLAFSISLNTNDEAARTALLKDLPENKKQPFEALHLEYKARASGNWDEAIDAYEEAYKAKPSPTTLIPYARSLSGGKRFSDLAHYSDQLLALGSEEGAELALQALYNSEQFEMFIQRVQAYAVVSTPQIGMRFAQGQALERLGRFQEAVAVLEAALEREQNINVLVVVARLHARVGDTLGLRRTTDRLLKIQGAEPDLLMGIADIASLVDRDAAIRLWRSAATRVSDNAVSIALSIGYRLGLDADPAMEYLTKRLVAGAGRSQKYTLDELRSLLIQNAATDQQRISEYNAGRISIHMLVDANNVSLPAVYAHAFDQDVPSNQKPAIFTRYGGRGTARIALPQSSRFNIDITSLLMLHFSGILNDIIERVSIKLPAETVDILNQMLEKLIPAQPSEIEREERMLARLENAEITSVSQDEIDAAPEGSVFGSVADEEKGILPYQNVVALLEGHHEVPKVIYLVNGAGLLVQDAGLLPRLLNVAQTRIPVDEERLLKSLRAQRSKQQTTTARVRELIVKLQTGLGTWYTNARAATFQETSILPEAATVSLLALIQTSHQPEDVVLVDDRFVSSLVRAEHGSPTIDTFDLLRHMLDHGDIERSRYEAHISSLREANVLFIPIQSDEIVREVMRASVDSATGKVVETPSLIVLRRYIARTLQARQFLQAPGTSISTAFPYGEVALLLETSRAIVSALSELWEQDALEDEKRARVYYVLQTLYFDDQPDLHAARLVQPSRAPTEVVGLSLASLLVHAMSMPSILKNGRTFVEFLSDIIVSPRIGSDPDLLSDTSRYLRDYIVALLGEDDEDRKVRARMLQEIVGGFPDQLARALAKDATISQALHLREMRMVTAGASRFNMASLWKGAERFLATKKPQRVRDAETGTVHSLTVEGTNIVVTANETKVVVPEPTMSVFHSSVAERLAFFEHARAWFDIRSEAREAVFERAAKEADPLEMMRQIGDARNGNASMYYTALMNSEIQTWAPFESSPPSLTGILEHLRLKPGDTRPFADRIEDAGCELMEDIGLAPTIARLALLPTTLPEVVKKAYSELRSDKQAGVVRETISLVRIPIALANIGNVVLAGPTYSGRDEDAKLLLKAIDGFFEQRDWLPAYLELLQATKYSIDQSTEVDGEDRAIIAWYHAGRMFDILLGKGVDVEQIREHYQRPVTLEQLIDGGYTSTKYLDPPSSSHFMITSMAYLLGKSTVPVDEELLNKWIAGMLVDGLPLPGVMLLEPESELFATTRDYLPDLESAFGSTVRAAYERQGRDSALHDAVETLESTPQNVIAWTLLRLPPFPLDESLLNKVREIASHIDMLTCLQSEPNTVHTIRAMLGVPELFADEGTRNALLASLDNVARSRARGANLLSSDAEIADILNDAACAVARTEPDMDERARIYATTLLRFARSWPSFLALAGPYLTYLSRHTPVSRSQVFASLILSLRSM